MAIQKITPFLWYKDQADEAAKFYCSIFKNSKIIHSSPMVVTFELEGQRMMALNGGPQFNFSEAVSFFIDCETQEEIDYYWYKLISDGGSESMCGWLKDKYGLWWQVIPGILGTLMTDAHGEKANLVVQAMLKMKKLDIKKLKSSCDSAGARK